MIKVITICLLLPGEEQEKRITSFEECSILRKSFKVD